MELKTLDTKQGWLLVKVSLLDYIESLTEENFNYDIQRGIVPNAFLDTILEAIDNKKPLPPISIVTKTINTNSGKTFIDDFNILDGLQRTFRLWIYYQLATLALQKNSDDYRTITQEFRKNCDCYSMAVSPRQVRKLFKRESQVNIWNLKDKYAEYDLYLYIWTNLTTEQEIKQMIILNAGQKQMNLNHQFELMYMRLFSENTFDHEDIKVLRSKDGKIRNRKIGEYALSSVIIGIQSLVNAKPMRLSRDMLYQDTDFNSDMPLPSVENLFTRNFVQEYLDLLYELDKKISANQEDSDWFAKDTTLSGMMAGIGEAIKMLNIGSNNLLEGLKACIDKIQNIDDFSLNEYKQSYDGLSSVKINIGLIVRKAIMYYTSDLLVDGCQTWSKAFKKALEKNSGNEKIGNI